MSVTPVVVICDGIVEDVCTVGPWIRLVSVVSIFINGERPVGAVLHVSPYLIAWIDYACVSIACINVVVGKHVSINSLSRPRKLHCPGLRLALYGLLQL